MTKTDLRQNNQRTIDFCIGENSGTGTLNYVAGDDAFQIIYFSPQFQGGASTTVTLTEEMIAAVSEHGDNLVMNHPGRIA